MNKINHEPSEDLAEGRWWLKRAAQLFASEDVGSTQAYTAAVIGNGFIGLAHTTSSLASMAEVSQVRSAILTMSDEPETTLAEAIEREKRAEAEARPHAGDAAHPFPYISEMAEARPHDDELTANGVGSLSESIALALGDAYAGIEFEDPTFERGTEAVMEVLRERAQQQPKHALDDSVLWVVADSEGPIHAGTQEAAQRWADENRDDYEGLTVTAMEVDRG